MVKLSDIQLTPQWAVDPAVTSGSIWFTNNYGVSILHREGVYEAMVMKRSVDEIGKWDIVVHPTTKRPLIQGNMNKNELEELMTEIETFKVGEM